MDVLDRDVSTLAWGIAGAPLLVTLVQTVLSLLDWTSETLGVEGLLAPVFAIDVLFEAAVVFKEQPALVTSLFVLIAAAWIVQGFAMINLAHRDLTFAAAGFAAILYFVLFFGVYSALFGRDIGTLQLVAFFSVPVVAAGLVAGSALTHDWSEDVLEASSERIGELEVELDDTRETFRTEFDSRLAPLDAFERVAPSGVAEVRSDRDAFLERCDEFERALDELRSADDPQHVRSELSRLESGIDGLDPVDTVDRLERDLRRKVRSGVRTEFGGGSLTSRFGGTYVVANLPTEHREVELPPSGSAVHVNDLREVFERRLESDDLSEMAAALDTAVDHRERLRSLLDEREADTAETIEEIERRLTTVEEQVERFSGGVAERVREVLIENRSEGLAGVRAIEQAVRDAKSALHDCRFDDVDRILDEAARNAETLVSTVEFLRSLDGRMAHGGSDVDVPSGVPPAVVGSVATAFGDQHGTEVTVTDGRVEFGDDDAGRSEPTDADDQTAPADPGPPSDDDLDADTPEKRPEEVLDSALYFLRELEEFARDADGDRIQYQTDDLPPGVGTPATLANVERFLAHQSDLFEDVTLQSTEPPAFIELIVADDVAPTAAVRTARDRYVERYG